MATSASDEDQRFPPQLYKVHENKHFRGRDFQAFRLNLTTHIAGVPILQALIEGQGPPQPSLNHDLTFTSLERQYDDTELFFSSGAKPMPLPTSDADYGTSTITGIRADKNMPAFFTMNNQELDVLWATYDSDNTDDEPDPIIDITKQGAREVVHQHDDGWKYSDKGW